MSIYTKLINDLFVDTTGGVTVTDSDGASFTHHDLSKVAEFASKATDPVIDLVTDEGEAVGIFVMGNPDAVQPAPSFNVEGGMVYMLDGEPALDQQQGLHLAPLNIFFGGNSKADLAGMPFFKSDQLNIETSASRREIVLMSGRSRQEGQGKWKPRKSTFGMFIDTLRVHTVGEKDGACFLQGESADGARKSSAQIANYIIGVDLDAGAPLGDIVATIQKHKLEAVIYTTHSHLKDTTEIKRDHFMKHMDASEADEELLKQYLIEWKGVLPEIVAKLEVLDDAKHSAEGVVIVVRHNPIPKFRAVFPLSEPFVFAKRGGSQRDAILEWKERYAGFCTDMGFFFDEVCVDPARLFYLPRHKKNDTSFASWHVVGDAVDLDKFSRVKISRKRKAPSATVNAFTAAGAGVDDDHCYIAEDGFNLRRWAAKHAKRFEIETMLTDVVGGDFIRESRQSGKPGVHVECPFEAEHSNFGGSGTFVVNAGDNYADGYEDGFTFHCVHNACHGRDRLEFLKELLDQGVIEKGALTNEDYLLELEDDVDLDVKAKPHSDAKSDAKGIDEEGDALHALNSKYAVLMIKNAVSILVEPDHCGGDYQLLSGHDFKLLERNRTVLRFPEKGPPKSFEMSQEWLAWERRRLFKGIDFYPGGNAPADIYNSFTGWPVKPAPGSWSILQHHLLNNVCEGFDVRYDYLLSWIADIFQNPQQKPGVATVLTGGKGCGKSKVFEWLKVALGRYAVKLSQADGITGKFNAHHENKLLLVADEAVRSIDSRTDAIIKDMITSSVMQLEGKGRDQREVNNFMRLAMLSNDDHVVRATLDERRYFVLRCGDGNIQDHAFFEELDQEMKNGGVAAMMHDLLNHQPKHGWASLRRPPMTPYLRNQQALTLDALDRFIVELVREEGYETDEHVQIDLYESTPKTHSCLEIRIAANDYMKSEPYQDRVKVDYTALCLAAKRMVGASDGMGERDGNRGRFVIFPPLREARKFLERNHGIVIDRPAEIEAEKGGNVIAFDRKAG